MCCFVFGQIQMNSLTIYSSNEMMALVDNILETVALICLQAYLSRIFSRRVCLSFPKGASVLPNLPCKCCFPQILNQIVQRMILLVSSSRSDDGKSCSSSECWQAMNSERCAHEPAIENLQKEMNHLRLQLAELLESRIQKSNGLPIVDNKKTSPSQPSPLRFSLMKRTMAEIRSKQISLKPVSRLRAVKKNSHYECEQSKVLDAQDLLYQALRQRFSSWNQCSDDEEASDQGSPDSF